MRIIKLLEERTCDFCSDSAYIEFINTGQRPTAVCTECIGIITKFSLDQKQKKGRPTVLDSDLKKTRSIRLSDKTVAHLTKTHGTLQKAIDALIKADRDIWE